MVSLRGAECALMGGGRVLRGALWVPRVLAQPPNSSHRQTPGQTPPPWFSLGSLDRATRTNRYKMAFQPKKASKWI